MVAVRASAVTFAPCGRYLSEMERHHKPFQLYNWISCSWYFGPQMTRPCNPVTGQIVSYRVLKTSPCLFIWISGGMVANQSQPVLWLLAFCLTARMKCKRWVCGCGFTSGSLWVCWGPAVSWCFPLIEDTTVLLMESLRKHRVIMVTYAGFSMKLLCAELGTCAHIVIT